MSVTTIPPRRHRPASRLPPGHKQARPTPPCRADCRQPARHRRHSACGINRRANAADTDALPTSCLRRGAPTRPKSACQPWPAVSGMPQRAPPTHCADSAGCRFRRERASHHCRPLPMPTALTCRSEAAVQLRRHFMHARNSPIQQLDIQLCRVWRLCLPNSNIHDCQDSGNRSSEMMLSNQKSAT
jgi:hypothetical protein